MMVQVPFVSLAAGNLVSGAVSTTLSASCTTGLPIMGTETTGLPAGSNYGDGCLASQAIVSAPWGNAVDTWGNVYFSDQGHKYVRVIYAGPVTVGGVLNPAGNMIAAAYGGRSVTPVAGNVYAIAGGYATTLTAAGTTYYCTNNGSGTIAGSADGANCPATYSYIGAPYSPAVDSDGNLFIVDKSIKIAYVVIANASSLGAQLVALENPTTFPGCFTTTGCTAGAPQVGYIYKIASGNSYTDKVLASTSGALSIPYGIAVDANENLYITDYTNNAIRMVNGPNNSTSGSVGPGFIHTIGGNCTSACTALSGTPVSGSTAIGAAFLDPMAIAVDSYGNVYVGDNSAAVTTSPSSVRVIYAGGSNNPVSNLICVEQGISASSCSPSLVAGDVYTIAGNLNASATSGATGNGALATSSAVKFEKIQGLALDSHGNIYIADYSSQGLIAEVNATTGLLEFLAGDSSSALAVGNNCASGATAGSGPTMTDAYGDGCPATESKEDHIEGNPAFDASGNLYFSDNGYSLIRKLTFSSSFPETAVGSSATQNLAFELLTGSSSETASSTGTPITVLTQGTATNSEFTNAGGTGDICTTSITTGPPTLTGFSSSSTGTTSSSSSITTCVLPVTFAPVKAGARSGAVQITATVNSTSQVLTTTYVNGVGSGATLAIDPGTVTTLGSGIEPQGVATDSAGNTYIAWYGNSGASTLTSTPGGAFAATAGTGLSNPHQVAVDGAGNVFVADTGNNRIAEFVNGTTTPVSFVSGLNAPQGVALDASGNLYIADTGNKRVLFQPVGNGGQVELASGFTFGTPVAVAVDSENNIYVADTDSKLDEIIKIPAGNGTPIPVPNSIATVGLAVDAAGDIDYIDSTNKELVEILASGSSVVVASGLTTPIGVALDANGGLYVADTANSGVSYYNRTAASQTITSEAPLTATVTNIGNLNYTGSISQTDSTDFSVGIASGTCSASSSFTLDSGTVCGLTTSTSVGSGSDTVSLSGSSTTLNLTAEIGTTTTLGGLTSTSLTPTYGDTITVTATVTAGGGSSSPTGSVYFTVDGGTATTLYALTAGTSGTATYTYTLPTLTAGSHTVTAKYTPTGGAFTSSSTSSSFPITVAPLAITASATAETVTYGQTVPAITGGSLVGVLTSDTANVIATFSTTATSTSPVSGSPYPITVQLSGSAASNYSATVSSTSTVTIQPVTVSLVIDNASMVVGQSLPTFTGTLTGVLSQDTGNVSPIYYTTGSSTSPVGTYSITATGLTGTAAGNYTLGTVTPGTLTIATSVVSEVVTVTSTTTVIYGQVVPAITGTFNPALPDGITATFSSTASAGSSAGGSYPITVQFSGTDSGNYQYTFASGSASAITIQQATVNVIVTSTSKTYGAAIPSFTGTLSGVIGTDPVSAIYSTTATQYSAVNGTTGYSITVTGLSLTGSAVGNYTLGTVTSGTLTITKLGITATATTPVTVTYGQAIPTITGSLSGVVNGDNVTATFSTTATSTSPVSGSPYSISVQLSGTAAGNYSATVSSASTVTIQPATVSLVINPATMVVGQSLPTFTGTLTGVLSQDTGNVSPVYSTTGSSTSPAGTYDITATGLTGTAAGNYTLGTVTAGILTITSPSVTAITAAVTSGTTYTYGQAIPTLAGTLTGVLTADQGNVIATFTSAASAGSSVGTYPITVRLSGSAAANYTVTLAGTTAITIHQAAVNVVANSISKTYGSVNPTLTGTLTGVYGTDSVSANFSTAAVTLSPVGSYPITVSGLTLTGSAAGNYSLGVVTQGTLTVTQASSGISLITSNATIALGAQPTFTATVSSSTTGTPTGSVTFNDGTTVLGTATLSNGVATNSPTLIAGTHTITAVYSGDKNFATSTSSSVTETVQLPIVTVQNPPTTPTTISSGSSSTVSLTLNAQGNYTGTATLSCMNLPAGMTCSFNPSTATFSATGTTTTTILTISTSSTSTTAQMSTPQAPGEGTALTAIPALCIWLPGTMAGLLGLRKRKLSIWQRHMLMLIVLMVGMIGIGAISGCGGSSGAVKTQPGTYTIQVEITAGTVQTVPLTVVVQ
jgi:sugar lactone lactonase YvrE